MTIVRVQTMAPPQPGNRLQNPAQRYPPTAVTSDYAQPVFRILTPVCHGGSWYCYSLHLAPAAGQSSGSESDQGRFWLVQPAHCSDLGTRTIVINTEAAGFIRSPSTGRLPLTPKIQTIPARHQYGRITGSTRHVPAALVVQLDGQDAAITSPLAGGSRPGG